MGSRWTTDKDTDWLRSVWTFSGGIFTGMPSVNLSREQSSDESGWATDRHPALHTARGMVKIGTEAKRSSGVAQLLTTFQHQNLVRVIDGNISTFNDTNNTWSAPIATGMSVTLPLDSVNFEVDGALVLILVDGVTGPRYWKPNTMTALPATTPKGKFIVSDTVRVWVTDKDIMHFSARLNAKDWTTSKNSGFIQAFTTLGGDASALTRYRGRTIIFKQDYMAEIRGTNYFEFALVDVSNQVGCWSQASIAEVGGMLFWLGNRQVYAYQGGVPEPIGDALRDLLDKVDWTKADLCWGGVTDKDEYALGLMLKGQATAPTVTAIFDPKTNVWRIDNKAQRLVRSAFHKNSWYTMDPFGNVYRHEGYNDVSTVSGKVESYIVSPPFSEGMPEAEKEYFEMHIQGKIARAATVSIYVSTSVEGGDFVLIDTVEGDAQTHSTNHIIPLDTVPLCNWARIKLVASGEVELHAVELYYNLLPVQH